KEKKLKYLVTSALPYANGPIHLGHLAGAYLPADVFVRYLRNMKRDVVYVCGTDEHGVPITINAESRGITPEDVVKENHELIARGFEMAEMSFDIFSGTHNDIEKELSQDFFKRLDKNGFISVRNVEQFYCEHDKMFLPDRYVEGTCPICKDPGARGDQCDKCGNALNSLDLINPKCKICGQTPVKKSSKHWFLDLDKFEKRLDEWLETKENWKSNVKAFCKQWFERGLEPRGITRDISWGVPVPVEGAEGKVLYVWFDAPIGYIAFTKELFAKKGLDENEWEKWWKGGDDVKLIHFIGKDNIVFHSIIWPAMLMGQEDGWKLPDEIPANEFLNLEGQKISTSRNWAIWVHDFLERFNPDSVRFYLSTIAPETKDSDFSFKGFQDANNGMLAAIYGNFVNRNLAFINKFFGGKIEGEIKFSEEDDKMWEEVEKELKEVLDCYETFRVRDAAFHIMEIGRIANKYFDAMAPWALRKSDPARCNGVFVNCLNLINTIATVMEPITPAASRKVKRMLNLPEVFDFTKLSERAIKDGIKLGEVEILFGMIDDETIAAEKSRLGTNH
ncbi:methionine--tRNA ligase, partial [bacterium]|nr:methionine--tRNA ligase [bacterium]